MNEQIGENVQAARQPTLQIGSLLRVTGVAAYIVQFAILGLLVALIIYLRPRWGMLASGTLWLAFTIYWGVASKKKAAIKSSESANSRRWHESVLDIALLLLFIPVPGLNAHYLPAKMVFAVLGLGIQCAFFALAVWARRILGLNWSGAVSIKTEHQLVRTGPYRWIRHPIYTAMFGMFIGTALVGGQIHALVGVALLIVAYTRKIRMEEGMLREHFGAEYEAYRRKSWALVPGMF
ncbi:MAG TPA: isoprenylcysteine carboxylmethyltransferase family protein [Candidatus Acidoferrales bacterium]|nr:isoprenylcysteine carboxylmethyltransferase family protein [Candidatus Acidoferrales bacterium]